jgi:hypothetical protein
MYQFEGIHSQSSLYQAIEHDSINNDVAAFVDPSTILLLPDLGLSSRVCRGSLNFDNKFIAANIDRSHFINQLMNGDDSSKYSARQIEQIQALPHLQAYLCPSEYVAKICALDCQNNTIKVWGVGSGKLLGEHLETQQDYRGFKKHEEWNGTTLIVIDKVTLAKKLDEEQSRQDMSEIVDRATQFYDIQSSASFSSHGVNNIGYKKGKV